MNQLVRLEFGELIGGGVMNQFWVQMAAPFMLFLMLLIAWPFKRAIQVYMKDTWLKRLLLRRLDGKKPADRR